MSYTTYTENETKNDLRKELVRIENLYNADCVNRSGKTKDTKKLYTEVIAQELLINLKKFLRNE